jgi:hypothetical protein
VTIAAAVLCRIAPIATPIALVSITNTANPAVWAFGQNLLWLAGTAWPAAGPRRVGAAKRVYGLLRWVRATAATSGEHLLPGPAMPRDDDHADPVGKLGWS